MERFDYTQYHTSQIAVFPGTNQMRVGVPLSAIVMVEETQHGTLISLQHGHKATVASGFDAVLAAITQNPETT